MCTRLSLLSFIYRVIPNIFMLFQRRNCVLRDLPLNALGFRTLVAILAQGTQPIELYSIWHGVGIISSIPQKRTSFFGFFHRSRFKLNAFHGKQIWMFSPYWRESVPYDLRAGLRDLGKAMRWTSKNHVWGSAIPRTKHDSLLQYTLNVLLCLVRIWRIFNMNNDNWTTIPRSPHIKAPTRQHCSFFHKLPMARQLWHLWQLWNDGEMIKFTSIAFQMNNKSTWHVYPIIPCSNILHLIRHFVWP